MNHPTIQLKKGREKSAANYHPWIFSGAVEKVENMLHGDIVGINSSKDKHLGYGFYDQQSQITCRLFHFGDDASDFSKADYWQNKIEKAFLLRKQQINFDQTNCYRLIHAEGDLFPGLIVDIYHDTAVVQLLVEGTVKIRNLIFAAIEHLGIRKIFVKNDPGKSNGYWVSVPGEEEIVVLENGLEYYVNVVQGQKTGFFLDQRENRRLVSTCSKGKNVLNLFSYTGGFSVAAGHDGAIKVTSVDVSASAMALCAQNMQLNSPDILHEAIESDGFKFLHETDELFDLIVIDPPAFAKHRSAVNKATRGYKDLNMTAIKKVASPGMIFTFSCSQHISRDLFQKIVFGAAADAGRSVRILKHLEQPEDHPVSIFHPEGEYLKGLWLWVD